MNPLNKNPVNGLGRALAGVTKGAEEAEGVVRVKRGAWCRCQDFSGPPNYST